MLVAVSMREKGFRGIRTSCDGDTFLQLESKQDGTTKVRVFVSLQHDTLSARLCVVVMLFDPFLPLVNQEDTTDRVSEFFFQ